MAAAMVQPRFLPLFALGNMLLLAGCSGNGGYPSLAPRPIEQSGDAVTPPAPAAPAEADAALSAEIARHSASLSDAKRQFDSAADSARRAIAAAGNAAPGTRAWLAAQTALGQLDDRLGATRGVAGALDALLIERAASGAGVPDLLTQADEAAQNEVKRQGGVIATLSDQVKAP